MQLQKMAKEVEHHFAHKLLGNLIISTEEKLLVPVKKLTKVFKGFRWLVFGKNGVHKVRRLFPANTFTHLMI